MLVAFTLPGNIPVYTFSLVVGIGAAFGLARVAWLAPDGRQRIYVDAGLWSLFGALVGGRLAYVMFNWPYYDLHHNEIFQVWLGGLSWAGALAGGMLALAIFTYFTRRSIALLADVLLPLLVSLTVTGWLACWLTGCAYGPQTTAWWGVPSWDEWGVLSERFPTQFLGAVLALVTLWLLHLNRKRLRVPGQPASLGLLCLSLEFFALTYFRADPMPNYGGLRLDAWGSLFYAVFSFFALVSLRKGRADRHPDNSSK